MSQELIDAFTDMREQDVLKITDQMLDSGTDPLEALEACRKAMEVIGQRFEDGDCFLPELILAGEMLRQVSDKVKPRLQQEVKTKKIGKVIMGTVEGDIHDIGKDIVIFMLDVNGFEVMDLGVNVPVARFIEAAKEFEPQVIGLSGFLTLAFDPMKATVEALKEAGLRDSIKVMIGGGQIDDQVRKYTGADAYGRDAVAAVTLAKQWVGEE
ncbi:MAG: methionine synthase [Anaerolineales bacterium]|nr:MAG: methionine synthase [Anaerolineales bacterium]